MWRKCFLTSRTKRQKSKRLMRKFVELGWTRSSEIYWKSFKLIWSGHSHESRKFSIGFWFLLGKAERKSLQEFSNQLPPPRKFRKFDTKHLKVGELVPPESKRFSSWNGFPFAALFNKELSRISDVPSGISSLVNSALMDLFRGIRSTIIQFQFAVETNKIKRRKRCFCSKEMRTDEYKIFGGKQDKKVGE